MIKIILQIISLLLIFSSFLYADFAVILKAEKEKRNLLKDKSYLYRKFPKLKIKITPTTNKIWRFRIGIYEIESLKSAENIKNSLLKRYKDAYILKTSKNAFPKIKNVIKKRKFKDESIKINFSNLSLEDLVKLVSKITKKNILITKKLKGKIDFLGEHPVKKSRLLPLLNQILRSNGYMLKDTSLGFLKVVKNSDAIKEAPKIMKFNELD